MTLDKSKTISITCAKIVVKLIIDAHWEQDGALALIDAHWEQDGALALIGANLGE
jgi:hypothetical protein